MTLVDKTSCGVKFRVVDPATYPYATYEFDDEHERMARCWSDIQPGEFVLDLGAGFGGWTLPALAQGARVVAVEPSSISGDTLDESVRANGWGDRYRRVQALLWDDSPVPECFRAAGVRNYGGKDDVEVTTLDALVLRMNVGLSRIKFDLEGAEGRVLSGGREVLRLFRPRLVIEVHDIAPDDHRADVIPHCIGVRARCLEVLAALDYDVTVFEAGGAIDARPR